MSHAAEFLIHHGYAMLFVWLLLEQGALPLPSIPLLLACGALARTGQLQPVLVVASGLAACLVADNIWFQLGRRKGGKVLHFLCRVALEPDSCVRRTENAFRRYGVNSLLISKFVPGLNAVAAPLAGSSGIGRGRFLLFDTTGALLWILCYTAVGYVFSGQIEEIGLLAMRTGSRLGLVLVVTVGAWVAWKYSQRRRFLRKIAVLRITPQELQKKLDAGEDVFVVDLRSRRELEEDAIPGAMRVPAEELAERHGDIPRDRDVILFCS
ncbi:MAG: VTT domain-containing protein [Ignavibacteriota bacterium]